MSFEDEIKNVIGPSKRLREYMEWLKKQPRPDPEKMEAQFRAEKRRRELEDPQTKSNDKFHETGRKRRGGYQCHDYTEDDLRAIERWKKFVEAERKQRGS